MRGSSCSAHSSRHSVPSAAWCGNCSVAANSSRCSSIRRSRNVSRDPKGLYRRALAGEIKNFTGVDQPYEVPENPELHLLVGAKDADRLANDVIEALQQRGILKRE